MDSTPSIRVENLTRKFGRLNAVKDISFTVNKGEVVGFLGPNGAGKSTTMRILCGIMQATSGSAWIEGVSVAQDPQRVKQLIGYMPENNPLPENLRVAEYLDFRARLKGVPRKELRATVKKVMDTCDLARTAQRKIIGTLSKGFRQRVGIADALLGDPKLIIMDEPTIGLDPHQIQGIRKLIDQLRGNMTVVLSSHILPEIERSCDRVIIINQGRVVAAGTSAQLRQEFLPGNRFEIEIKDLKEDRIVLILQEAGLEFKILNSCETPDGKLTLSLLIKGQGDLGSQLIDAIQSYHSSKI